jgi:hypothetical protein
MYYIPEDKLFKKYGCSYAFFSLLRYVHVSGSMDFNIMQETGILRNLLLLSTCALVTPGRKPKITTLSSQDVEGYRAVSMYLYKNKRETKIHHNNSISKNILVFMCMLLIRIDTRGT